MRIVFDPTTLQQSKMGAITAVIYFEFKPDRLFPGAGWNDFVVVILNWWFNALNELVQGELTADLRFMDGPYWVTARSCGNSLKLRCVENRSGSEDKPELVVEMDEMRRELLLAAGHVSKACSQANINSAELAELRGRLPN